MQEELAFPFWYFTKWLISPFYFKYFVCLQRSKMVGLFLTFCNQTKMIKIRPLFCGQALYFHLPSSHVQLGPFQLKIRNYTLDRYIGALLFLIISESQISVLREQIFSLLVIYLLDLKWNIREPKNYHFYPFWCLRVKNSSAT